MKLFFKYARNVRGEGEGETLNFFQSGYSEKLPDVDGPGSSSKSCPLPPVDSYLNRK
jgi:hypothetical protein